MDRAVYHERTRIEAGVLGDPPPGQPRAAALPGRGRPPTRARQLLAYAGGAGLSGGVRLTRI